MYFKNYKEFLLLFFLLLLLCSINDYYSPVCLCESVEANKEIIIETQTQKNTNNYNYYIISLSIFLFTVFSIYFFGISTTNTIIFNDDKALSEFIAAILHKVELDYGSVIFNLKLPQIIEAITKYRNQHPDLTLIELQYLLEALVRIVMEGGDW